MSRDLAGARLRALVQLSDGHPTLITFGRDLLNRQAKDERLDHMVALVLAALTGKSPEVFGREQALRVPVSANSGAA